MYCLCSSLSSFFLPSFSLGGGVRDGGNSSVGNGGKRERNGVLFLLGHRVWRGVLLFFFWLPAFLPLFPPSFLLNYVLVIEVCEPCFASSFSWLIGTINFQFIWWPKFNSLILQLLSKDGRKKKEKRRQEKNYVGLLGASYGVDG